MGRNSGLAKRNLTPATQSAVARWKLSRCGERLLLIALASNAREGRIGMRRNEIFSCNKKRLTEQLQKRVIHGTQSAQGGTRLKSPFAKAGD
jgi:hypothetical protein